MFRRNKTCLIVVLALILSGSIFAEKITVWAWYEGLLGQIFRQLIEEDFVAKTGIEVEVQSAPVQDMNTKLLLAVAGGEAPDIVELFSNQIVEFGVRGALENLGNMPDLDKSLEQMHPGLMRQLTYNNAVFALPGEANWTWSYYRTDILSDIGSDFPKTWDELKALSIKLSARDMQVYYDYQGDEAARATCRFLPFVFQRGTDIYTEDGTASNLDDPVVIEAFRDFVSLFKDYNFPIENPTHSTFIDGSTPIQIYQNWYYSRFTLAAPQIEGRWAIDEMPGTKRADGTIDYTNTGKMLTWAMPTGSKHKEAAWKFMQWVVSPEFTAKFSRLGHESPENWYLFFSTKDAIEKSAFPEDQRDIARRALANCKMQRAVVGGYVADRYIDFAFTRVVLQDEDPEKALVQAAKDSTGEIQRKLREFSKFISRL
ncbi:MAG: sugar ABC transporter substrate-binding protein [Firmicutes bacterium]|nr:sugar ABC transporter substrate-binding protein [Bacillota bacterium]